MKLECSRIILATAFGAVGAVIPNRTPKPILQNVKLQVMGGKTTLIGTDSEIAIRYDVPEVICEGSGEALLPTRRVIDILRNELELAMKLCGVRSVATLDSSALWS